MGIGARNRNRVRSREVYSSRPTRDTVNIRCTVNLPLSFHPGTETGKRK